ncbi:MAG: nitroreductase family protein [Candidatus Hermodarchaeota archaeon]
MIDPEEFLKFLKERRSIRNFQEKEISNDKIEMILEAGRWTPSASNKQPWEFIVIKDKEIRLKVAKTTSYGKFLMQAPVLIAIVGKTRISPKWYIIDTSLVTMNMMLMAWSLGIGTCWIGAMNRERARDILNLSQTDYVATILPFGYPEGEIPSPTARKRKEKLVKEI